jgi:F-type H+-transporting ATPase subunit gamma
MPNPRDLRRRIRSVRNTAQITKAMQMVAASKMRKAQQMALAGRPYASVMGNMLAEVTAHAGDFRHPLMRIRELRKRAVIVVSTDKGLCGALNSNLLREAVKFDKNTTVYIAAGRKAAQFIARTRRHLAAEFTYKDAPQFGEARAISKLARDMFINKEVDRVDILFANFVSTVNQRPEVRPLLPVGEIKAVAGAKSNEPEAEPLDGATEFLFEPNAARVFEALLPHYLNFEIYHVLLEAKASEHSARMVAMKNATDNALELIRDLTLEYNKLRQATITKELLEIATAQMAMG